MTRKERDAEGFRMLWLSVIGANLQDACGVLFNYPRRGGEGEEGVRSIQVQKENLIEQYKQAEAALETSPCAFHKREARVKAERAAACPTSRKLIKNNKKRCGKCWCCAVDKLYPYSKRPSSPDIRSSRHWLETDRLEEAANLANIGGATAIAGFKVVQEAITAEKHLHEEFTYQHKLQRKLLPKKQAYYDRASNHKEVV